MLSIAVFLFFVLINSTSFSMIPVFMRFVFREVFFKIFLLHGAERVWPPSVAMPNGEGEASGEQ